VKNSRSKVTKHFSLLLDGKLTCRLRRSGYIIFCWGTELPNSGLKLGCLNGTQLKSRCFTGHALLWWLQKRIQWTCWLLHLIDLLLDCCSTYIWHRVISQVVKYLVLYPFYICWYCPPLLHSFQEHVPV